MKHALILLTLLAIAPVGTVSGQETTEGEISEIRSRVGQAIHYIVAMAEPPECGTPGECNHVVCPAPTCSPDQTPSCKCTASGQECGPFWDKRPVYNCECTCYNQPPPPPPDPICIGTICIK